MLGQFTTADKLLPGLGFNILGLSRYAYVEGNPIARTDPSHCFCDVPGTGDNFFPQSGGRLLAGNTRDVYSGPSYSYSYHLSSWTARPHNYAPYQPYRHPARRPAWAPRAPGIRDLVAPITTTASAARSSVTEGLKKQAEALLAARQAVSGYFQANGSWVESYLRRFPGATAQGVGMAELADNLGPPGVFADANIALLVELHRYREVQGPRKWLGIGFSAAIDIASPAIIGAIGGVAGAAIGAAADAGEGTVV